MIDKPAATALIELQYLPTIAFFAAITACDVVELEAHEYFEKQTYRNRTIFLSSQQTEKLTVPLIGANKKIKSRDIRIDQSQLWANKHWRTLKTCYGKSPYFEFFEDEFYQIYKQKHQFLWDLNLAFLTKCLRIMQIQLNITETGSYKKQLNKNVIDYRSLINPKREHLLEEVYKPVVYQQNFGNTFEANLSVVDLIMNEGPNAFNIIKKSTV
jgi:hypothetical protein